MIKLRAVPVLLAIAGLMAGQSTMAQTTATVGGGPFNPPAASIEPGTQGARCDSDGRNCISYDGGGLVGASYIPPRDTYPSQTNAAAAAVASRRADRAWAKGDRGAACGWIKDAQWTSGTDDYAAKVDQYCARDTARSTDRS